MEMPVIRVSDRTWDRMKVHARPLEDTPDDIVRRALDALEGRKAETKTAARIGRPSKRTAGQMLPQKEFRSPLLLTLDSLGGSASLGEARKAMYPRVSARLSEADQRIVSTGEPRWWNATCWERSELVKEGYLRSDSPRGQWELSNVGKQLVARLKSA